MQSVIETHHEALRSTNDSNLLENKGRNKTCLDGLLLTFTHSINIHYNIKANYCQDCTFYTILYKCLSAINGPINDMLGHVIKPKNYPECTICASLHICYQMVIYQLWWYIQHIKSICWVLFLISHGLTYMRSSCMKSCLNLNK
jgi:hypothetical protein